MTRQEEIETIMMETAEIYLSPAYAKGLVKGILLDLHLRDVVIRVTQKYPLQPHFIYEPLVKE